MTCSAGCWWGSTARKGKLTLTTRWRGQGYQYVGMYWRCVSHQRLMQNASYVTPSSRTSFSTSC